MAHNVPSPCVDACKLDRQTRICIGCGRALIDIAQWSSMSQEEADEALVRAANNKKKEEE